MSVKLDLSNKGVLAELHGVGQRGLIFGCHAVASDEQCIPNFGLAQRKGRDTSKVFAVFSGANSVPAWHA
jgi:hypothetical protein